MSKEWKSHLADLWDGRKIYVVDGEYVRDHYFADFTEGGNCCADPDFVPKNEIWVERLQTPGDLVESLVHEIVECTLMCYKIEKNYDDAHDATNTVSSAIRKVKRINKVSAAKLAALVLYPEKGVKMAPKGPALKDLIS